MKIEEQKVASEIKDAFISELQSKIEGLKMQRGSLRPYEANRILIVLMLELQKRAAEGGDLMSDTQAAKEAAALAHVSATGHCCGCF